MADEPTSALDVSVQRQVVREMLKLRELFGTAIIIVTHDIGVVRAMADTVLVLKNGKWWNMERQKGVEPSTGSLYEEAAGSSSKA